MPVGPAPITAARSNDVLRSSVCWAINVRKTDNGVADASHILHLFQKIAVLPGPGNTVRVGLRTHSFIETIVLDYKFFEFLPSQTTASHVTVFSSLYQ
jgi:hypothetical protein